MADQSEILDIHKRLLGLINTTSLLQDFVFATMEYLREQPTFDAVRFRAIFESLKAEKAQLAQHLGAPAPAQTDEEKALAQRIEAFLRRFEGPPQ